jgi:hypothetical protein
MSVVNRRFLIKFRVPGETRLGWRILKREDLWNPSLNRLELDFVRLIINSDITLSTSAFKINWRRYTPGPLERLNLSTDQISAIVGRRLQSAHF